MSWAAARQYCCQIGMDLLSFESVKKITHFTNLALSIIFAICILHCFDLEEYFCFILLEYRRDFIEDFWTSGNDFIEDKSYKWCVEFNTLAQKDFPWKATEPSFKGDCVYAEIRNDSSTTVITTSDCATPRKFICEVNNLAHELYMYMYKCLWQH
jgi:hypothetical protein